MPRIAGFRQEREIMLYDTYVKGDNKFLARRTNLFVGRPDEEFRGDPERTNVWCPGRLGQDEEFVKIKQLGINWQLSPKLAALANRSLKWTYIMGDMPQYSEFARSELLSLKLFTIPVRQNIFVVFEWLNASDHEQFMSADEYKFVRFEIYATAIWERY